MIREDRELLAELSRLNREMTPLALRIISNVWGTRHRLLLEKFERLAKQLSNDKPEEPTALEERTLRLLAAAITLLRKSSPSRTITGPLCYTS